MSPSHNGRGPHASETDGPGGRTYLYCTVSPGATLVTGEGIIPPALKFLGWVALASCLPDLECFLEFAMPETSTRHKSSVALILITPGAYGIILRLSVRN